MALYRPSAFTAGAVSHAFGCRRTGGVFLGMVVVGIAGTAFRLFSLKTWVVLGCIGSAAVLLGISALGRIGPDAPLLPAVIGLGFFNGMFAVAAIGSMMALAGEGRDAREGTRMGLWGAAQAIAAGFGGLLGAALVDLARISMPDAAAFGAVFSFEALLYLASAAMALRVMEGKVSKAPQTGAAVPGE